ncbi:MAG TPA: right-handed parallel beta-helix repeat-containing protein, partial [Polyangiaceae bacterium]|nr:right-handed parallel beta-helix repeat-containing protein [Polyangiaceae bacterium]
MRTRLTGAGRRWVWFGLAALWGAGCTSDNKNGGQATCEPGTERCPCDHGACNAGLSCLDQVCVHGTIGTGGVGGKQGGSGGGASGTAAGSSGGTAAASSGAAGARTTGGAEAAGTTGVSGSATAGMSGNAGNGVCGSGGGAAGTTATTGACPPEASDRIVATTGVDRGDCSIDPCLTFRYAGTQMRAGETLVVEDGTYADSIGSDTFPPGSPSGYTRIVARHPGAVTIEGRLDLYENREFYLELAGLRFVGDESKNVAGGHVRLVGDSFVNGPPDGNAAVLSIGTNDWAPGAWNIEVIDTIVYGHGGRYDVLVYRANDVTLTRLVARKDGGWSGDDQSNPEGVVIFYESSRSVCDRCVVLDSISESGAEPLGGIIVNSHDAKLSTDTEIRASAVIDSNYPGITLEGHGDVNEARIIDSYASGNSSNGVTLNVGGDLTITRLTAIANRGDGIANYGDITVSSSDCLLRDNSGEDLRGVPGTTTGSGAAPIDFAGFDQARVRRELCAGETRGFCGANLSFAEHVMLRAL